MKILQKSLLNPPKPNFKKLGPKLGGKVKFLKPAMAALSQEAIFNLEATGELVLNLDGEDVTLTSEDIETQNEDIPGWLVANSGTVVVALDITITDGLAMEGLAREIVNRVQNIRKNSGFDVTDKVAITLEQKPRIPEVVETYRDYICNETLAQSLTLAESLSGATDVLDLEGEAVNALIEKI